jgi:hypothetical protein
MEQTKRQNFKQTVTDYILGCVAEEDYNGKELKTDAEKLQFVYDCFKSEYWHEYNQKYYNGNQTAAFTSWLQGLPSSFGIDFEPYTILQIAKRWDSIPENATEKQEDKILENWFNFISVKTFQLFRKYKIA